jgi:hypothetical protein
VSAKQQQQQSRHQVIVMLWGLAGRGPCGVQAQLLSRDGERQAAAAAAAAAATSQLAGTTSVTEYCSSQQEQQQQRQLSPSFTSLVCQAADATESDTCVPPAITGYVRCVFQVV